MENHKNIICCSGGNDSVALIQWARNRNLENVTVLYNQTGWEAPFWHDRLAEIKQVCQRFGFRYETTTPLLLFKDLVRKKKGFPMAAGRMQWCSDYLKKQPTRQWLYSIDPDRKAHIFVGIRREESQNRAKHPRRKRNDPQYDGRQLEYPLVAYTENVRDELIKTCGIEVLPHSSMECFPCVCSNRSDFRHLAQYPARVNELAALESEMGYTSKGKPRVMFRPYRHMGAVGIWEVVRWANCERGKYLKTT